MRIVAGLTTEPHHRGLDSESEDVSYGQETRTPHLKQANLIIVRQEQCDFYLTIKGERGLTSTIPIPARLLEILERDRKLHGCVTLTLDAFEPWLKSSGTPFFPEYTDHGPQHIADTLVSAQSLIADEAYDTLTAADVAALALSVLIHDCAMHLDEVGFIALVTQDAENPPNSDFQDLPWSIIWHEFLSEASRFDARKLINLFGDPEPAKRPPLDSQSMTRRDRLLIGEFLRRHHHRLAHEIALHGVPSDGNSTRLGFIEVPSFLSEIAGVLARSHGMSLRNCVDVLRSKDHHREYQGIHPTFLMGVIRIADYLQIQAERAPEALLQVRHLQSPTSQREWRAHAAITDKRHTHDDPEALFIEANPINVETYLRVQEWLNGIQNEMDLSWAMLGEVYGRFGNLSKLGFVLRRVRSNLDNRSEFAKTVEYVPCRATFEAANPDLLKLLVGPLYGGAVDISLRELVQNAVDAVRERHVYSPEIPKTQKRRKKKRADVQVSIEKNADGEWWVSVQDHGIGMTLDTLLKYFLKAGATFRRSDVWRAHFEDESGRAKVLRSGRFGVGVLASFLLGDKIFVSTRHVDAAPEQGYSFSTTLDEDCIEIRQENLPVGTTIRIPVAESLYSTMEEWIEKERSPTQYNLHFARGKARDGYCLLDPLVEHLVKPEGRLLRPRYVLPSPGDNLPLDWAVITHADYDEIHWSYIAAPRLACNGILVDSNDDYGRDYENWNVWWREWDSEVFEPPKVSVFDGNGNLPLTLQRTNVARTLCPFSRELLDDVAKDFIAYILVYGPTKFSLSALPFNRKYSPNYPGLRETGYKSRSARQWFLTSSGFGPTLSQNLIKGGTKRLLLLSGTGLGDAPANIIKLGKDDAVALTGHATRKASEFDSWLRCALKVPSYHEYKNDEDQEWDLMCELHELRVAKRSIVLRKELLERYDRLKQKPIPKHLDRDLTRPWNSGTWGSICEKDATECDQQIVEWAEMLSEAGLDNAGSAICLWELATDQSELKTTELNRVWDEVVGVPIIPYKLAAREKELAHAYRVLEPYVERHRALKAQESKKRSKTR